MIVPVGCSCMECPPWALVELQGELDLKDPEGMTANGFDLGVLCLKSKTSVHLTIGYHQLEGKVEALKKPFAILEKVAEDSETRYEVVGAIHHKILFKTRPKALISKPT